MQNIKKPTWVTGDGTLLTDSLTVLVRRDFAQPLPLGEPSDNREVHDRWIISASHQDGCGEKVTTNIALDHQFYDGKSATVISKVSNSFGSWKGRRFFADINLETEKIDSSRLPAADACLLQVIKALYDASKEIAGAKCDNGTPIPLSEGEDGIFFNEVRNVPIKLIDAELINYADAGQVLVECLARDDRALAVRMNNSQAIGVAERISDGLKVRHDEIQRTSLPDGISYDSFLAELVGKGLSLGSFISKQPDDNFPEAGRALKPVAQGTTCLLADAIDRNDTRAISALMSQGADPLLPLNDVVDGNIELTSPFKKAVLNGRVESLVAMVNNASEHDTLAIIDAFKSFPEKKNRDSHQVMKSFEAKLTIDRMSKNQRYAPY